MMSLVLATVLFISALQLRESSAVEDKFRKAEGVGCEVVVVQEGAAPVNCRLFMQSWNRGKEMYRDKVGKTVQADKFKFYKRVETVWDGTGTPGFYDYLGNTVYALFIPYSNTIMFASEDKVWMELFHAMYYYNHPFKLRKAQYVTADVNGYSEIYVWQIIGHGTPDDPLLEK